MTCPAPTTVELDCLLCRSPCASWVRLPERTYFRCPVCSLVFLDPARRLDREAETAHYGLHQNAPHDEGYRRFLSRLAAPVLERLSPNSHGLDYGCGPGPALAAMLGEAGHRVALYDPVFEPHEAALRTRYDFVVCSETAEHFHHPLTEFERLFGLLRPGGWLGLMTGFLPAGAEAFGRWHYIRDPTHVVFYGPDSLAWLASRFGARLDVAADNVALFQAGSA